MTWQSFQLRAVCRFSRNQNPMNDSSSTPFLITDVHHVSFVVADTARSLTFYRDVLGLVVDESRPDLGYPGAWLIVGQRQIHLLELPNPDPLGGRPEHGGRDRHMAMTVDDLDALVSVLNEAGVAMTVSKSGRRALFCRDPDRNALEFIEKK